MAWCLQMCARRLRTPDRVHTYKIPSGPRESVLYDGPGAAGVLARRSRLHLAFVPLRPHHKPARRVNIQIMPMTYT